MFAFTLTACSNHISSKQPIASQDTTRFNIDYLPYSMHNMIVHSDTTFDMNNYHGHIIRFYDNKERLAKITVTNLFESDFSKIYAVDSIYDTTGHVIYEDQVMAGTRWHCYQYEFDSHARLITRTGYSSGDIGSKLTYIYEGDKLVKQISEPLGKISVKH
jgi:hypothetical protein